MLHDDPVGGPQSDTGFDDLAVTHHDALDAGTDCYTETNVAYPTGTEGVRGYAGHLDVDRLAGRKGVVQGGSRRGLHSHHARPAFHGSSDYAQQSAATDRYQDSVHSA